MNRNDLDDLTSFNLVQIVCLSIGQLLIGGSLPLGVDKYFSHPKFDDQQSNIILVICAAAFILGFVLVIIGGD